MVEKVEKVGEEVGESSRKFETVPGQSVKNYEHRRKILLDKNEIPSKYDKYEEGKEFV